MPSLNANVPIYRLSRISYKSSTKFNCTFDFRFNSSSLFLVMYLLSWSCSSPRPR